MDNWHKTPHKVMFFPSGISFWNQLSEWIATKGVLYIIIRFFFNKRVLLFHNYIKQFNKIWYIMMFLLPCFTALHTVMPTYRNKKCAKCGRIFLVLLFLAMIGCIIGLAVVLTLQKQNKSPEVITTTPAPPTDDREEAPTSATGLYRFGAVASDNEQCSRVGT